MEVYDADDLNSMAVKIGVAIHTGWRVEKVKNSDIWEFYFRQKKLGSNNIVKDGEQAWNYMLRAYALPYTKIHYIHPHLCETAYRVGLYRSGLVSTFDGKNLVYSAAFVGDQDLEIYSSNNMATPQLAIISAFVQLIHSRSAEIIKSFEEDRLLEPF